MSKDMTQAQLEALPVHNVSICRRAGQVIPGARNLMVKCKDDCTFVDKNGTSWSTGMIKGIMHKELDFAAK